MAINNFQFPGVELTQEFVSTPVTGISTLGVVVVGPQTSVSGVSDVPINAGTATVVTLPSGAGTIDPTSSLNKLIVKDGLFLNYEATTSSSGISVQAADCEIAEDLKSASLVFNTRVTSGTASEAAFGTLTPVVGGTVDVTTSGSTTATTAIIKAVAGNTVSVEVSGSTLHTGTVSSVKFYSVTDATFSGADITNTTATTMTLTANPTAKIGGKTTSTALLSGTYDVELQYSNLAEDIKEPYKLGSVGSRDEIVDAFGEPSVANPMALALLFALYASISNRVYYVPTDADSVDAFEHALGVLDKYSECYSVVPLTRNSDVIRACIANAEAISGNSESKVRRVVWYGIESASERSDMPNSYRAQAVFADGALYNGEIVPNYIVAAAPAGMRAYEPTYRPISNLGYTFFSLAETHAYTEGALKDMGANGVWIIANNFEGTPINKKQVTTAVANDLNLDEESIVANADSIALTLCHVGEDKVGNSNISPALLKVLSDTITGVMDNYLVNLTGNAYIGPQLLSWSLDSLYQHQTMLDHIYAVITCEPPKPFNRFVMTLRIV